jgi:tape measure domain-containing protein
MGALGKLVVDLVARTAGFEQGMLKATSTLNRQAGLMRKDLQGINQSSALVANGFRAMGAALVAGGFAAAAQKVAEVSDKYTELTNKIGLATARTGDFDAVMASLRQSANNTGQSLGDISQLFLRMSDAKKELGASNADMLGVVDTINKLAVVSGSSTESLKGATLQLSQLFGTGRVYAEEFNSVMEGLRPVAAAVADELGITVGALKQKIKDGEVSSKIFFEALRTQADETEAKYRGVEKTFGMVFQAMADNATVAGGTFLEWTGITETTKAAIESLSRGLYDLGSQLQDTDSDAAKTARTFGAVFRTVIDGSQIMGRSFILVLNNMGTAMALTMAQIARTVRDTFNFINNFSPLKIPTGGLQDYIKQAGSAARKGRKIADSTWGHIDQDMAQIGNAWKNIDNPVLKKRFSLPDSGASGGGGAGGDKDKKKKKGKTDAERLAEQLKEQGIALTQSLKPSAEYAAQVDKLNKMMAAGAIQADVYNLAIKKYQDDYGNALGLDKLMEPASKAWGEKLAKSVNFDAITDGFKTQVDEINRVADEAQRKVQDGLDKSKQMILDLRSPLQILKDQIAEIDALAALPGSAINAGNIDAVKQSAIDMFVTQDQGYQALMNGIANYGRAFEDTFINAVMGAKFSFKDLMSSILEDLARLVLRLTVINPLISGIGRALGQNQAQQATGTGGGGGFFGSLLGGIGKSLIGGGGGFKAFADGGLIPAMQPAIVGERGPELFLPGRSGSIVPNHQLGGAMAGGRGGGGTVVHNHYTTINAPGVYDTPAFTRMWSQQLGANSKTVGQMGGGYTNTVQNRQGRRGVLER